MTASRAIRRSCCSIRSGHGRGVPATSSCSRTPSVTSLPDAVAERLDQAARLRRGRPQVPDRLPHFADVLLHLLADAGDLGWRTGIGRRDAVLDSVELQRESRQALQQRVVNLAPEAHPLAVHRGEVPPQILHAEPPGAAGRQRKHAHAHGVEPERPVERGRNPEVPRRGLRRPRSLRDLRLDRESIGPRRQVRVEGLPPDPRIDPVGGRTPPADSGSASGWATSGSAACSRYAAVPYPQAAKHQGRRRSADRWR